MKVLVSDSLSPRGIEILKKAGLTVDELQKRITVASLKSLQSNGYGDYVLSNMSRFTPNFGGPPSLQQGVIWSIGAAYNNLDRV